ncbi:hypothetical protein C0J52_13892, partial [Blattella germanica]
INTGDDVPEIYAAIFRGRRIYQELPAPAINHMNRRDNTALRTAPINSTFSQIHMFEDNFHLLLEYRSDIDAS